MLTNTLKKRRTPNLTFFIQIGSAITFTINNYVKHRILHAMRIVDAISQIKTGETNVDVPIVDVKKNSIPEIIMYDDLYSNFLCSNAPQILCIIGKKFKISLMPKNIFFKKTAFSPFKNILHYRIF